MMAYNKSAAASMHCCGGPRWLNCIKVCMVSFLQHGHCSGLYGAATGLIITKGAAGGNCAFIHIAAFCLLVLLSIP